MTPGWYGKLPCLGDFASRRLGGDFVEPWDRWLAEQLARWRQLEPERWLAGYLAGPSWRWLLMPGALAPGSAALAGVLMPSVDKVGRYFPFTALVPLAPGWSPPGDAGQAGPLLAALHRLDDLALDAMQDDWPIEQLEAALGDWAASDDARMLATAPTQLAAPPAIADSDQPWQELPCSGDFAQAFVAALAHQAHRGRALWWSADAHGNPLLRASRGLPLGPHFRALMTARPPEAAPATSPSPSSPITE